MRFASSRVKQGIESARRLWYAAQSWSLQSLYGGLMNLPALRGGLINRPALRNGG